MQLAKNAKLSPRATSYKLIHLFATYLLTLHDLVHLFLVYPTFQSISASYTLRRIREGSDWMSKTYIKDKRVKDKGSTMSFLLSSLLLFFFISFCFLIHKQNQPIKWPKTTNATSWILLTFFFLLNLIMAFWKTWLDKTRKNLSPLLLLPIV